MVALKASLVEGSLLVVALVANPQEALVLLATMLMMGGEMDLQRVRMAVEVLASPLVVDLAQVKRDQEVVVLEAEVVVQEAQVVGSVGKKAILRVNVLMVVVEVLGARAVESVARMVILPGSALMVVQVGVALGAGNVARRGILPVIAPVEEVVVSLVASRDAGSVVKKDTLPESVLLVAVGEEVVQAVESAEKRDILLENVPMVVAVVALAPEAVALVEAVNLAVVLEAVMVMQRPGEVVLARAVVVTVGLAAESAERRGILPVSARTMEVVEVAKAALATSVGKRVILPASVRRLQWMVRNQGKSMCLLRCPKMRSPCSSPTYRWASILTSMTILK